MPSFIKLIRSDATRELLRDPLAFVLLVLIAIRARWSNGLSVLGLKQHEAFIGDVDACGLTPKQYICAKKRLTKYGLVAFRRATTGARRGTIATLLDARVFDIAATDEGECKGECKGIERALTGQLKGDIPDRKDWKKKGERTPRIFISERKTQLEAVEALLSRAINSSKPEEKAKAQNLLIQKRKLQERIANYDEKPEGAR